MQKRDITQLAIYQIDEDIDRISIECLRDSYLYKTSEIVYIVKKGKLYGIVCLEDVLRYNQNGDVLVNRKYTALKEYNTMKARKIFRERVNINKIPVVNKNGELLGDYSRWDDLLYVRRKQREYIKKEVVKKVMETYRQVYVIVPVENKLFDYKYILEFMQQFQLKFRELSKDQFKEGISEGALSIFLDEEERRGVQCLYGYEIDKFDMLLNAQFNVKCITYAMLLRHIMRESELESLGFNRPANVLYDKIDEKTSILFSALKEKGVNCFCLYLNENKQTEYGKKFEQEVAARIKRHPINLWPKKKEDQDFFHNFFCELTELKQYDQELVQKEASDASLIFERIGNVCGKYFNAMEGKRVTCFQPSEYVGTVYLLGPCTIIGFLYEDQYTISSYLQSMLLKKGYAYRVENLGSIMSSDSRIDSRLQNIEVFSKNDIVIMLSQKGEAPGIQGESLEKIFERNKISSDWVTDGYTHCNHRVNSIIADSLFDLIKSVLLRESEGEEKTVQIDFRSVMRDYVQKKYINFYFSSFIPEQYNTVGSIVINGNPFSKGHYYLIEQASQQVDLLIVFVVEEDASLFSFEERFKLIVEGTKELDNVMVIPSGEFILSKNNFLDYFSRVDGQDVTVNAEYDINVFADCIASKLHITHRFAGEEPEDCVTKTYNEIMKKILPLKGITFVEIPRIEVGNEIVSASKVRKYLEENCEKAFSLVPETTKRYLMQQL